MFLIKKKKTSFLCWKKSTILLTVNYYRVTRSKKYINYRLIDNYSRRREILYTKNNRHFNLWTIYFDCFFFFFLSVIYFENNENGYLACSRSNVYEFGHWHSKDKKNTNVGFASRFFQLENNDWIIVNVVNN